MKSWKTTVGGIGSILGGLAAAAKLFQNGNTDPTAWTGAIGAVSAGLGLLFARDNKVTSEQAGAKPPSALPIVLLFLLPLFSVGCASTGQQVLTPEQQEENTLGEISFWANLAASVGTEAALLEKPQYRPAFERALVSLDALAANTNGIDPLAFRVILNTLPVKELKSPEARLAITTATILFQRYGKNLEIDRNKYVSTAVIAVRDGIRDGLAATAPTPKPTALQKTILQPGIYTIEPQIISLNAGPAIIDLNSQAGQNFLQLLNERH